MESFAEESNALCSAFSEEVDQLVTIIHDKNAKLHQRFQDDVLKQATQLKQEREALEAERRAFEEMKQHISNHHFRSTVKLDIGGAVFARRRCRRCRSTRVLCLVPCSVAMDSRWNRTRTATTSSIEMELIFVTY